MKTVQTENEGLKRAYKLIIGAKEIEALETRAEAQQRLRAGGIEEAAFAQRGRIGTAARRELERELGLERELELEQEDHLRHADRRWRRMPAAAEFRPDVAFLDIGLPKLDGYGVARSADVVYIQITVFDTRTAEQKKALFRRTAELLESEGEAE